MVTGFDGNYCAATLVAPAPARHAMASIVFLSMDILPDSSWPLFKVACANR
jgi:hypothetical protein